MENNYTPIKKKGNEHFISDNIPLGFTVGDFWSWAYSDLATNTDRGKLAEFIVASALGITDNISSVWDSFDLLYKEKKIEIKSSSYLQSWYQKRESYISFGVRETQAWDATTGKYEKEQKRQADIYVFCLLKHKDKRTLNPMDFDQWEFYIVPTSFLNSRASKKKIIPLAFLQQHQIAPCTYTEIRSHIEQIMYNPNEIAVDDKSIKPSDFTPLKVKNAGITAVVYKKEKNDELQTTSYVGDTKTQIVAYCREIGLTPKVIFTFPDLVGFLNGTYNKSGAENITVEYAEKELKKYFYWD